jgi:signal transduction histidine kinase
VKTGGRPPAYFERSESKPFVLKLLNTARTRPALVKITLAISASSQPRTDSSTMGARRQITAEPALRLTGEQASCPEPVQVDGDATRLSQIAADLLTSAVKFSPPA